MKRNVLLVIAALSFVCCTPDYSKDIIGWWASDDATPNSYVYYIIRDNGTYKKRMKGNLYGAPYNWTERGSWEIKDSKIFFNVETFNGKTQNNSVSEYEIYSLKNKKLVLETKDGKKFVYINTD